MDRERDIATRYAAIRERIASAASRAGRNPADISVIAVTKTFPAEAARAAFTIGLHDLGENRVQELIAKSGDLVDLPIRWHLIGHLQTNKVKAVLPIVGMIHSVDSIRLAEQIQAHAESRIDVCLQVNTSGETSKFGVSPEEVPEHVEAIHGMPRLRLRGLMTLGPLTEDHGEIRASFRMLKSCLEVVRNVIPEASVLSMGMSGDYEIAIEEGATHIRLGTALFGERG